MAAWPRGTARLRAAGYSHTIKRIHVIAAKHGRNDPTITVQTSKGSFRCRRVAWDGPSIMAHDAEHPLSCGAEVWIETHVPLIIEL
jgi:hypothetical protein